MPNDKEIYRFRYLSLKANLEIAEKIHARQAEIDGNKAEIARLTGLFDTSSQERLRELTAGQASNEEQLKKLVLKKGSEFLPVDYLLDAGLGLKGTLYYAYTTTGKAASAEGSISPLGPIGLNYQAGLKLSAAKGKQRSDPAGAESYWDSTLGSYGLPPDRRAQPRRQLLRRGASDLPRRTARRSTRCWSGSLPWP